MGHEIEDKAMKAGNQRDSCVGRGRRLAGWSRVRDSRSKSKEMDTRKKEGSWAAVGHLDPGVGTQLSPGKSP